MNKFPSPGWDDKCRHVMPQTEMLYDNNGNLLHHNKESSLHQYTDFYDDETRAQVTRLYQTDIDNFGYEFEDALT
jgi:hypothetical protein